MDLSSLRRPTANYGTQAPKSRGIDLSNLRRPEPIFDPETIASGTANIVDDVKPKLRPPIERIQGPTAEPTLPESPRLRPPVDVISGPTAEPTLPTPGQPDAVNSPGVAESARERLRRIIATKAQDENGRLKSGLWGAMSMPVRPSDSLGNLLGQRLSNFLAALLNPDMDEESARQQEIATTQQQVTLEEQQEKAARDKAEQEADINYKTTQTQVLAQKPAIDQRKLDLQAQRDANQAQYRQDLIALGKQKADELKAYRDAIIELKERGADQNDLRIQQAQQKIDELIRHNKVTEQQTDRKIASQEKIAAARIEAQKQMAADRNALNSEQFRTKYPGAGKPPIPYSKLKAQFGDDADYHAEQAVKQGYEVVYDK